MLYEIISPNPHNLSQANETQMSKGGGEWRTTLADGPVYDIEKSWGPPP